MSITPTYRRRLGIGIAGLVVAAGTATIVATPSTPARAAVDGVTISGADFTVGGTYTLHADLSGASVGLLVYWSDNGDGFSGPKVPWPPGEASIDWTPKAAGQHILTAAQGGSTKSIVVTVNTGGTPPTTTTPPTTVPPTTTVPRTTTAPPTTTVPPTQPPTTTGKPGNGGTGSADGLPGLFGSS